jgi:hypothetical protein
MSQLLDNLSNIFTFVVKNQQAIDAFAQFLLKYGYVSADVEHSIEDLIDVIRQIQISAGLNPTGAIDGQTLGILNWPRCAVKDKMDVSGLKKWGSNHITYYLDSFPNSLTQEAWVGVYEESFKRISAVCNLTFERVTNKSDGGIIIDSDFIDGPSNILGETELPNTSNFSGNLSELIDKDEKWLTLGQTGKGIYLVNVVTHESCHALGVGHCMTDPTQLMAPYYSPNVDRPQSWDINQLQMRYGPPTTNPTSPPNTGTPIPTVKEVVVRFKNNQVSVDNFRLVPIN